MAQIKFVRKRSAARSYVEASHKVPRCGARDNVERLSRPVKTDPDGDHSQTPKSKLPVDQSLPSSSGDLSPNKTRSFLKKITPTSSKPAVESTCTVHAHRSLSLARNVYVVPDCDRRSVTMEGRSTAKTIADFESHCRDDRLLDVSHGIVGLLAERIHPDSAERKASVNRIESMYTSLDFPEDMMDLEKGIYIEFRRVFDIIRTQDVSLRYLYPSVRLHIIEEISREACEAYPNGIEPAAEALGVSLSELQNIIDDANDASSIHNIPHHLQYYKKAYPDTLIDPDMPPSGAVFWACVFLKSQALPLSLVYWYFTDQNIVLSPPQPDPASSLPAIDCTHSARSARTSDETSDSSLEWDPNIEASDLGHRWHVARRTGGYERRKSMNYELGKIPQELLAATVSHPARSASLFTAGGMSEAGTSPIRQSTSVSYKSSSQSGPPNSLPRTDCPGLIQGDARSSIPTPTPMRETVAVQPTTVLQNQLNQQPIPSTTAPNMLRGAPHPIRTSEHSDLAMQLKKAAAQPPHAKQRVAASRSGINSMQEQYYSIVSPRMPAGRQTPDNVSTPSPSKIHDAFSGGPGMMATRSNMPTSGPSLHSPFQHTRTTSSQSPYRSPALPGASLACLPPFPGPPSTDGNAAGFYSGRVHPASGQQGAQTTFGAQFAQPSSNDPFIGPEISGAMGPYLGIPGTKGFFTTSLPHQAGGAVYPSLSPSPMQEMPRTQHREGNSGDLSYSGPTINAGAVHAPSSDMLAPATSAAGGRVDVSSVAQVADLLKKGDHHRRSLRTTRGQRGSEGSNFSKAGS